MTQPTDFDSFKNHPVTMAAMGAVALMLWNSFNAGKATGETYATKGDLAAVQSTISKSEDMKHDAMMAELHDYSNKNRALMEGKFADYQTQTALSVSTTNAQLQVQGVKIDQLVQMIKDLRWPAKK